MELATKFGYRIVNGTREICGNHAYMRVACKASLKRLHVDCVDLYYKHRIDTRLPIEVMVIAESLSEEEIAGLKEMFKMLDTDNSGQITFEELKARMERVGANLKESEIYALMQAVGEIPQGLPKFHIPTEFQHTESLFSTAVLITGVAILESVGIVKDLATKNGYELDSNQEVNIPTDFFLSQG